MYKFFFEKITFSNILLVLLLRLLGSDVSYFELSRVLRKKKIVMLLEHFKISWISFNEEKNYIANKRFYSIEKSIKIAKKFSLLIADKIWNKKLILFFGEKRYLQIYLYDYLKKNTYRYFLYISLIKKKRIKDEKIFLWFENSFFSKITIKDEKGFFNLKPRFLEGLNLIPFVFKILTFISSKLLRILNKAKKTKK